MGAWRGLSRRSKLAAMNAQSSPTLATAAEVVAFWREAGPTKWFRKDAAFDDEFRSRFLPTHKAAARGELAGWLTDAQGSLALLILLDQLPRNAFRGTARMFATDHKARDIAKTAIAAGFDQATDAAVRNFFYLPFMHSENLTDQERAVELTKPLSEESYKFAVLHRDIIQKFGRFPHRNAQMGRTTTPEEQAFLDGGGFAG
jgi:uncharacterized protein (DUF924 family)